MATIAAGNHKQIYFDHLDDIVITPGSGGAVKFDCSTPNSAATRPTHRTVYSETTISIPAGSTVFLDAVGADATYTTDAGVISYSTNSTTGLGELDDASAAALENTGIGRRPYYMVAGVFGDSRMADAASDTRKIARFNQNWVVQVLQLTKQGGYIKGFYGVSGYRTDQLVANAASIVADSEITHVFMHAALNNITQAPYTHAVSGATIAAASSGTQSATDMIEYAQAFRAAGKIVFIVAELGLDASFSGTWSSAMAVQAQTFNNLMEEWCKGRKGAYFFNPASVSIDASSATNTFVSGVTYDGKHNAPGGALLWAQKFLTDFGDYIPIGNNYVNPSASAYSSDTSNPIQLLENPGFATRTGGTLGSGQASFSAWTTTQVVAAATYRANGGNLYYTIAGGTCGATPPTHTTGTASDGAVTWQFVCGYGAWTNGRTQVAKSFVTNASKLYYSAAGGVCGATAPTHTSGTASDGTVSWTYICSTTNTIPSKYTAAKTSTGAYMCSTEVSGNQIEFVFVVFFGAAASGSTYDGAYLRSGWDTASVSADFAAKFLPGSTYSMQCDVQIDAFSNLNSTCLRWIRADMLAAEAPPQDGSAFISTTIDSKSAYSAGLGSYPIMRTLSTPAFDCAALNTNNGGTVGASAIWSNFDMQVLGLAAGFAIVRIRNARCIKVD